MTKGVLLYSNSLEPLPAKFVDMLQHSYDRFYVIQIQRDESTGIALPDQFLFDKTAIVNFKVSKHRFGKIVTLIKVLAKVVEISPTMISAWNWELILLSRLYSCFYRVRLFPSIQDTREWMYNGLGRRLLTVLVGRSYLHLTSTGYKQELFQNKKSSEILIIPNVPSKSVEAGKYLRESMIKSVGYFGFIRGDGALEKILFTAREINKSEIRIQFIFAGIGPGVKRIKNCEEIGIHYLGPYQQEQLPELYDKVDAIFGVYEESNDKKFHSSYRYMDAIHYRKYIFLLENSTMYDELKHSGLAYPLSFKEDWMYTFTKFLSCKDDDINFTFLNNLRKKYVFSSYIDSFKKHYSIEFTDSSKS
jgi:hypothetical protein